MSTTSDKKNASTEAYFEHLERELRQACKREVQSKEGRRELMRATGLEDTKLLHELVQLGIPADGLIALRLFPLALVAWAERGVDQTERTCIMRQASEFGIVQGTTAWVLLDGWLEEKPSYLTMDAWRRYMAQIAGRFSAAATRKLTEKTEAQMQAVAEASGGRLGFGSVSEAEAAVIANIVRTLSHLQSDRG